MEPSAKIAIGGLIYLRQLSLLNHKERANLKAGLSLGVR